MMNNLIKSVSYDQSEIISSILSLHVPSGKIDLDPTYSKGLFYKNTGICDPEFRFDINPVVNGCHYGDSRFLPIEDESINCEMFDPPFLATTGASLEKDDSSNRINKRFGVYPSENELKQMYIDSLKEAYRILKPGGIMIFKCQDKVSSGKQYMNHVFVANEAEKIGFYLKDLFILIAKNRLVADWQLKNQKHARKFHSYFWVLKKSEVIAD